MIPLRSTTFAIALWSFSALVAAQPKFLVDADCTAAKATTWRATPRPKSTTKRRAWATNWAARYTPGTS